MVELQKLQLLATQVNIQTLLMVAVDVVELSQVLLHCGTHLVAVALQFVCPEHPLI